MKGIKQLDILLFLGVGEVRSIGDVRGDRGAPTEATVTATPTRSPGGRPPEWLGTVPEGHQAGAPHLQASATIAPLQRQR